MMPKNKKIESKILHVKNVLECKIIRRINRFVVDVQIGEKCHKAWINNTGRLHEFLVEGRKGFCMKNEKGRNPYRLFSIKEGNLGAIIDTQLQMEAFEKSLKIIPWLDGCSVIKKNAKLGESLIDYLLECDGEEIYLEVKSAVLRKGKYAMYPDCPSARGRKHIKELIDYVKNGGEGTILFIAALPKIKAFKPNKSADAELYELLQKAYMLGVDVRCIGIYYNPKDSFVYLFNPDLGINF